MKATVNRLAKVSGRRIFEILTGASPGKAHPRGQRGFTLVELLVVMAIIGILAGVVAGAVTGIGEVGQSAQVKSDSKTIESAADRFFSDAFPQLYPAVSLIDTDDSLKPSEDSRLGTDLGVRLINFEAGLPQDTTISFVPDFLKEIPDSAGLVSWRIVESTGNVFFAEDGALLARPSTSRLDVKAGSTRSSALNPAKSKDTGERTDYTFTLEMKRGDAAIEVIEMAIPTGYIIGGQSLAPTTKVGSLAISFGPDNPWDPAETIVVNTVDVVVVSTNQWSATVRYDFNDVFGTGATTNVEIKEGSAVQQGPTGSTQIADERTHTISIIPPVGDSPGKLTLTMDRSNRDATAPFAINYTDADANEAGETFTLVLFGQNSTGTAELVIQNPSTPAVYRWLAEQQTAIDVEGTFKRLAGNQAVIIKDAP